ncbi:MAG: Hsp20/alpha crystallin family protein [Deltaproteobacteria bacterium]|nr:MAG: Hsp20/alpha crystallin family protein [Deltaproteobacteria bacterium]
MADLKKWFPFKFKRNEDKKADTTTEKAQETSAAPARRDAFAPMLFASPFESFNRMARAMLSDPFFSRPLSLFEDVDRFFGDFSPERFVPSVDVTDEGKALVVSAELPGMDKDDVQLEVHDGALVLRGEKKHERSTEEEGCYRTERYFGSFVRRIPLPRDLDVAHAEATFDKGVLTVRLPKTASEDEPQRIPLK